MRILVTGARGFVGSALVKRLAAEDRFTVRACARRADDCSLPEIERVGMGELDGNTRWDQVLQGVEAVVHLAARVHLMHDPSREPLAAFRQVNVAGTLGLAR